MSRPAETALPAKLLVALGGNAIHPEGIKGTGQEQFSYAMQAARALLPVFLNVPELVLTHGNGPGVGKVLMRQAIASKRVVTMPLDICVANSQGGISYVIMQAIENALQAVSGDRAVAGVICEVEVDPRDPAFSNPDKPLGYFFSQREAADLSREFGWVMKEDAGRGWRMVVPSPSPKRILHSGIIRDLCRRGVIVITGGGGGIPVTVDDEGQLAGVEAVVDKDLTSALLALELGLEELLILTSVRRVALDFGKPSQRDLAMASVEELRGYAREGHFSAGSMGPKIEAVLSFLENGGKRAIIAHQEDAFEALRGRAGTLVTAA